MDPAAYSAAAEAVKFIHNPWQIIFTIIGFCGVAFIIWLNKKMNSNAQITKLETEARKAARDKQIDEWTYTLTTADEKLAESIRTVGEKLENHINIDKINEDKIQTRIDKMDDKLRNIETGMVMKQEFSIFSQKMSADFSGLNGRVSEVREEIIKLTATLEERAKHGRN